MANQNESQIVGFSIDYGTICTDYNTTYLDRDNDDPQTVACMRKVLSYMRSLLESIQRDLGLTLSALNNDMPLSVDDVASKRFLFYSLEKEITLQSFVMEEKPTSYTSATEWAGHAQSSILIRNDEDGECVTLFCAKNSSLYIWLDKRLEEIGADLVPFLA